MAALIKRDLVDFIVPMACEWMLSRLAFVRGCVSLTQTSLADDMNCVSDDGAW